MNTNWKQQLAIPENKNDWNVIADFIQKTITDNPNSAEAYAIGMYLLWDFLVEGCDREEKYRFQKTDFTFAESLLKRYYKEASEKFSNNAEYLFFIGYFSVMSPWYWGLMTSYDEETIPAAMSKKAVEMEPENILYRWGYAMSCNDKKLIKSLAEQMIHEKVQIEWLETKRNIGKYLIRIIEACAKE
jgi:hypothetical protein